MALLASIFGCSHACSALERRLDLALRKRASEAQEKARRIDWIAQAEHVARVTRETGLEHELPVEIEEQRAPGLETADREMERRIVYPDEG